MSETPDFIAPKAGGERDTAMPRFYVKPVKNEFKSNEKGHPVFEDREYVEIHIPGDRGTVTDRQVRPEDRDRWPREYAAFKAGQEAPVEGTPLTEWPAITRSQAEELKFGRVYTVEQLAALPDDLLNRTVSMGGFSLREKAKRFLEAAQGNAPMEKLAAENEEQRATINALQEQMKALTEQMAKLSAQQEPKA
jgi:hypothetical protein